MNPTSPSPARTVLDEVATWAGITTQPTARGATAILFERHELGHLHASRGMLGLPLPADRRAQVLEAGWAKKWFSDLVTKQLASRADAEDGIALLRESYDALRAQNKPRPEASAELRDNSRLAPAGSRQRTHPALLVFTRRRFPSGIDLPLLRPATEAPPRNAPRGASPVRRRCLRRGRGHRLERSRGRDQIRALGPAPPRFA